MAQYIYDAWGNCEVLQDIDGIGKLNPFRYRGYYYDVETGLYYLQTRYYDPELGRFISADSIEYLDPETIGGLNLYAYCGNNPVMGIDPIGEFFFTCLLIGLIAGAIIGAVAGGITAYEMAKEGGAEGWEIVGWTLLGIVGGAVVGGVVGAVAGAAVGAIATGIAAVGSTIAAALGGPGAFALASGGIWAGAAVVNVSVVTAVEVGVALGALGVGITMMAHPDSGRIRYNDGTGIDPETGKEFTDPQKATEYYKTLKDNVKKANWRKWMKGKGWRANHLKGLIYLPLAGEWFRRLLKGEW